jgi:hypothetical protein
VVLPIAFVPTTSSPLADRTRAAAIRALASGTIRIVGWTMSDSNQRWSDRTCYLAAVNAPEAVEAVGQVVRVLRELGLAVTGSVVARSAPPTSSGVNPRQPDFAVFVVSADLSASLAFEIGTLVGARRGVLLITLDAAELPLPLAELPQLQWPLSVEGLRFQLESFLLSQAPQRARRSARLPKPSEETNAEAPSAATVSTEPTSRQLAWERWLGRTLLEQEAMDALERAPFKVAPMPAAGEAHKENWPDAALWIPEIGSLNPVIVELKTGSGKTNSAIALAELIRKTNLHLGLLITSDDLEAPEVTITGRVAIVRASIRLLHDLAPDGQVRTTLWQARNELVHGEVG